MTKSNFIKKGIIGSAITLIGLGIVFWGEGWITMAGLWITLWGNNLERSQ